MRLLLHRPPTHVQFLPRHDIREFRDVGAARDFLQPLLADPLNVAAARRVLGAGVQERDVLEQLAARVVADNLQIVSCGESYFGTVLGTFEATAASESPQTTPLQDEEAAQAQQATAPAADETHFIEIELKDENGNVVPGELYFVELPDGSSISGRTGSDGKARVDGVDPGTAKVSFPDLDKKGY
ncbi:MAG TPA: hypothetical protein VGR95_05795 [Thermoanaerobaculia bacterium]|jgi:hypothetical protein|nr:hypothetical protein [Thermoanaerobaculia bacterium]